jgi:hypothetical protein
LTLQAVCREASGRSGEVMRIIITRH